MEKKGKLFLILILLVVLCAVAFVFLSKPHNLPKGYVLLNNLASSNFKTALSLLKNDIKENNLIIFPASSSEESKKITIGDKTIRIIALPEVTKINVPGKFYYHYDILLIEYVAYEYLYRNARFKFEVQQTVYHSILHKA